MDFLLHAGRVVCLTASVDELVHRIGDAATRPLLAGKDVRSEIERLSQMRQPYYVRAHFSVDTTGVVPSQVARTIAEELERA
jgi:shikimate kinase